jgi:type VI secretion system secreted protein VgrG
MAPWVPYKAINLVVVLDLPCAAAHIAPMERRLHLRLADVDATAWLVLDLSLHERIGAPWHGSIETLQPAGQRPPDPAGLTGRGIAVTLHRGAMHRRWHGVVMSAERLPAGPAWRRWRLRLAHPLAMRAGNRHSRIVTGRDAASLAADLLAAPEHPVRSDLRRPPPARAQFTQWRESDLAWCSRLLEDEGIALVCGDGASLLTDHPGGFAEAGLVLPWRPDLAGQASAAPALRAWSQRAVLAAGSAAVRSWQWRSPQAALAANAPTGGAAPGAWRDDGPGDDAGDASRLAGVRAEALAASAEDWRGEADHPGIAAGTRLRIAAPDAPEADGAWLVTAAEHRVTQAADGGGGSHACRFRAWPAARAWRPPRRTPRPSLPGLTSAVVAGPAASPYAEPDGDGCYRVRPLFDADGTESAALRLATPYAGSDHGLHLPLHRGAEVLLAHLDGDPDRPVIAAAVANPANPPVVTDANRSQCVLASAGGNRIVLEDAVGRELVLIDAARDRRATIGGDDDARIAGNRGATVAGSDSLAVQGDRSVAVARAAAETVGGAKAVAVGGAMQVAVGGALNTTVGGALAEQVGAAKVEVVAGERRETVGGDRHSEVGGDQRERTAGGRHLAAKRVRIEAADELALVCGRARIVLKRDGAIVIEGGSIAVKGSGAVTIKGSKVAGN